ncbi:RNase adapter RapZ [Kribbella sp. CA-253562]|uniref:RNase adapter RapZ n=1 Tax=Kribbella sp. CA-253562 TaxID=3239942 RepID=UPI003D8D8D5C
MARILVTGMSGTGKSTVLRALEELGFQVVDTDTDQWSEWVTLEDGSRDWVWREDAMAELLDTTPDLFVAGCKSNQGKFYPRFDTVVLLSAPVEVMLERIAKRTDNPYGKSAEERAEIIQYLEEVEPLLRASADVAFDTSGPLAGVVEKVKALAD